MAKRFTDTNKYKKTFFRSLPGPYKLFWDFLYHECDNAGIWHVDFEVAQIYIGKDMVIDKETALKLFNENEERVKVIENGRKWFILPFIPFQYGTLTPINNMHKPIISTLSKLGLRSSSHSPSEAPPLGAMDKDKDKEGVVVKDVSSEKVTNAKLKDWFMKIWTNYPAERRQGKDVAFKRFCKTVSDVEEAKDCAIALNIYLASEEVKRGFVMRGSRWFEQWTDWSERREGYERRNLQGAISLGADGQTTQRSEESRGLVPAARSIEQWRNCTDAAAESKTDVQ